MRQRSLWVVRDLIEQLGVTLDCPNEDGGRSPLFFARLILKSGFPEEHLTRALDVMRAQYDLLSVIVVEASEIEPYVLLVGQPAADGPRAPYNVRVVRRSPVKLTPLEEMVRQRYPEDGFEACVQASPYSRKHRRRDVQRALVHLRKLQLLPQA